jgi:hypothetical protein
MRDLAYITGLFAAFVLLAMDFPSQIADSRRSVPSPAFASFVELSSSAHSACLEAARTSWQVRSGSMGNPVIGSLDSGFPLLAEHLPACEKVKFKDVAISSFPVGRVDAGEYSLMPMTEGQDIPMPSPMPSPIGGDEVEKPFPRSEMLSTDVLKKIKEIMK